MGYRTVLLNSLFFIRILELEMHLPVELTEKVLRLLTFKDRRSFAKTCQSNRAIAGSEAGRVDVQVLRDGIFKDERSFNKLRREYGNPILLGRDVKRLANGDKSSWNHAALVIPGLQLMKGSLTTDFRKFIMSAFKSRFNEKDFWFEFEKLKLRLNVDQLLLPEYTSILYVGIFTTTTATPCLLLAGEEIGIRNLKTDHYLDTLAIVHFGPHLLVLHEAEIVNRAFRITTLTEEPWKRKNPLEI